MRWKKYSVVLHPTGNNQHVSPPKTIYLSCNPIHVIYHKAKYFPKDVVVSLNINFFFPLPVFPLGEVTRNVHGHKVCLMTGSKRKCAIKRCK